MVEADPTPGEDPASAGGHVEARAQPERNETPTERLDRNWEDLLQELRVVQTGVQLLTGFLLTLPFQSEFATIDAVQRAAYLATVSCAITATGFLVAPVSLHRLIFRRHLRRPMVTVAHYLALTGLFLLAAAIVGVVFLTFSVVSGTTVGVAATAAAALLLVALWAVLPLSIRRQAPTAETASRHDGLP
jgi:predicted neutral ceramidase superfamily lipid hydrolase